MAPFESVGTVFYLHFVAMMAVSRAVATLKTGSRVVQGH